MLIRCYDNGGKTADRYTVVLGDMPVRRQSFRQLYAAIGMSEAPFHPQGIGQSCEVQVGRHLGERVLLQALPQDCQKLVRLHVGSHNTIVERVLIDEVLALPQHRQNCSRGAPMGRSDWWDESVPGSTPLRLQRVRFVDGDYTRDGTYWGGGRGTPPLYVAFDGPDLNVFLSVRARTAAAAAALLRKDRPYLKFRKDKTRNTTKINRTGDE